MFKQKWQKLGMLICGFVILLRVICIIGSFFNIDRKECSYYEKDGASVGAIPITNISQKYIATHDRLHGLQIIVTGIPDDKVGSIGFKISDIEEIIYEGSIRLSKLTNDIPCDLYLNIPTKVGKEYRIFFNADSLCSSVPLMYFSDSSEYAPERSGSCSIDGKEYEGFIFMRYHYLEPLSVVEKVRKIACWLAIYLGVVFLLANPPKCNLVMILEVGIGIFYVEKNNASLDIFTSIFLIAVSFISVWNLKEKYIFLKQYLKTIHSKTMFWIAVFSVAFSLQGYYSFIYPEADIITLEKIAQFCMMFFWGLPLVITAVYWYEKLNTRIICSAGKIRTSLFVAAIVCMQAIPFAVTLAAFNPGITSVDTHCSLVEMAHSIQNSVDWHPVFYCLLLKAIISIWDSTYAVLFVQFLFWLAVMLEGFLLLRKKGWRDSLLLAVAFLIGTNISNNVMVCSIWKDIPYATTIMWLTIIIAKLIYGDNTKFIYAKLTMSLLLLFLIRQNGMVPYLIVSLCLLLYFKSKKITLTVAVSACLIAAIKGPLYSSLNIIRASEASVSKSGMYTGLAQDILGVYYFHGNISASSMRMILVFTDEEMLDYPYSTGTASLTMTDEDILMGDFIRNYVDTFVRNPILMSRVILARMEYIWNVYPAPGTTVYMPYTHTIDGFTGSYFHPASNNPVFPAWNDYYPARKLNFFTDALEKIINKSCDSLLLYTFHWRVAQYFVAALLGLIIIITTKKRKSLLLYAPLAGHILGLVLTTGWSDYRYYWPINLMAVWILLFLPVLENKAVCLKQSEEYYG